MTDDLELRKQIAAQAQSDGSATSATPAVRAFQYFLVPLIIVAVCVGVILLVNFVTVGSPRLAREWIQDIKDGGPNVRAHATLKLAQELRRMEADPDREPDRSLTPALIDIYENAHRDEHELRRYIALCLGFLRDSRASALLMEGAKKEQDIEVRAACFDALGTIKDPKTIPFLVNLLDDSNPVVRKYAAFNAGAAAEPTKDPRAIEALRKKLSDPVPDVTWNAAFALAYFLDDRSGTDILKQMLDRKYLTNVIGNDPNARVLLSRAIFTACNAAAKLDDESFLPALRVVSHPDTEPDIDVRNAAREAIAMIENERTEK